MEEEKKKKIVHSLKNKRKGGRGKRKNSSIPKESEIRREKENCSPISRRERKVKGKERKIIVHQFQSKWRLASIYK